MVFNAPNLILFFLTSKCLRSFFLEESISLYNEKSKCENASILRKYGSICMGEKTKIVFQIFEVLLNSESSNFHAVFCVFVIRVANNNAIFTWGKIFQYNVI